MVVRALNVEWMIDGLRLEDKTIDPAGPRPIHAPSLTQKEYWNILTIEQDPCPAGLRSGEISTRQAGIAF